MSSSSISGHTDWAFPDCGEESPLTFRACWNCGFLREGAPTDAGATPARTPYLDQVLKNEGGPFGSVKL